jgi:hypothetical protein
LIALIAGRLAPEISRRRVMLAGLWLAALCPFTANYTAVVLTETLTIFLTALAILVLLETDFGKKIDRSRSVNFGKGVLNPWFLAGIVVGFGTLVRPETPLVLFAAGLVLAAECWRPVNWAKLFRTGLLLAAGTILPLVPWAARNWNTLHDVQFLAPRYSELPGEYTPLGFNDWTNTWLWHFRDVYLTQWKLNEEEISLDDLPASAFDSAEVRARVSDLLDQYNEELTVGPALDQQFREVARERTRRHPLRTHLQVPFLRSLTLWFTPRIELLPYSGHLWPVRVEWEDDRPDFLLTLSLVFANVVYLGLALAGAWIARRQPGTALLIAFIIVRTAFFTTFVETPEPRYVLECFPAVIALGARVFSGRN